MKLLILRGALKEGLSIMERITPKNPTLPILSNIFLKATQNTLELAATDLEIGVRYLALAKNETPGSVVIPAKSIALLIGLFSDNQVALETKGSQLAISSKGNKSLIKTQNPEDFPIIPTKNPDDISLQLETQALTNGLAQVVGFVGQSQARPEISGVFFHLQKKTLHIAATDSFRLAEKTLSLNSAVQNETSFILPQKTARELISIFGEKPGTITLFLSPNQAVFEYKSNEAPQLQIQVVSRLIVGEYPKYQDIIPTNHKTLVVLSKEELVTHLKAASIFTGKTNDVRFLVHPQKNTVGLQARSPEVGEHESSFQGKIKGEKAEISFNGRFLADGLLHIKSSEVEIGLNGEDGPATIKATQSEGYLYVLMPIKA